MFLLAWLAVVDAQQVSLPVEPIYALPSAFNAQPGERMRLGSLVPPAVDAEDLVRLGITFFVARTNELGSPGAASGAQNLASLADQRKAFETLGTGFGVSIFTTFPDFDDSMIVGEGAVNLIDGSRMPTFSPWDIERVRFSAIGYGAVNRALSKLDVVTLKILSEYGDASFFTGLAARDREQIAIWERVLRTEPPKAGIWSGDPKALAAWQRRLASVHGSNEQAYADWGMEVEDPSKLPLPITPDYPYSARLQFMSWYRDATPSLVGQLAGVADEIFLETPLLVPLGPPSDLPYLGLDIYSVAKAAGKADGIKVTNLGFYDFAEDWAMSLGRTRGAARATNTPVWTEAPTVGTPTKFDQRIFEALSLGSRGHIDWAQAYRGSASSIKDLLPHLTYSEPRCDVAVIYPSSSHVLRLNQTVPALLFRSAVELRDYLDFDVLEESAVIAGALSNYRVAVLLEGSIWDVRALNALRDWVRSGGVIAAYDFGRMADPFGGTSVWQELFGWSTQLPRARADERWQGAIPEAYRIDFGGDGDEEFVQGRWGTGGEGGRFASNGATLRLPARTGRETAVTVHFASQSTREGNIEIFLNGRKQAGLTLEGGISRFQFIAGPDEVSTGTIRIGFDGMAADASVRIAAIEIADPNTESPPGPLVGFFEAPVDPAIISREWSRRYGQGLTVFMPGQRTLWKTYIGVVRALTYRLAEILEGAKEAPALDDRRDGIFVTDLGDRVAVYNPTSADVVKSIATPTGRREIRLGGGRLGILSLRPPAHTIVIQCEDAPNARKSSDGLSAMVQGPEGLTVFAQVPRAGRFRLFARTTRDGRPAPVRFTIAGQDFAPITAHAAGDLYSVGSVQLPAGEVKIVLSADREFEADLLVLTDDPSVSGYRLARE